MTAAVYRGVVLLLWVVAVYSAVSCRGLFWDGASFLVNILDLGGFHDFYTARAHVDWVTQAPVIAAAWLGVRDLHLLSIVYSFGLFALPVGLYHLALARARHDPVMLAIVIVILATVYLPTSFFIVGEYNAAFAAVTAAMVIALTARRRNDAVLLCFLGLLCLRSYEALVYLGPLLAACILWSMRGQRDPAKRLLLAVAALAFVGAAIVSAVTIVDYWSHPHFAKVRSMSLEFWQNLQFSVPLAGLLICAVIGLVRPEMLRGRLPIAIIAITSAALLLTPWYRLLSDYSILYPPSHYLARQAAGLVLAGLLVCLWVHVAWRNAPPRVLTVLSETGVARRLVASTFVLFAAATIPDVALTRLWTGYLDRLAALVDRGDGIIPTRMLPLAEWPDKLFAQDWSLPALSAVVSRTPGRAYVIADKDYLSNPPFDPSCGTLPRLAGYQWGRGLP
ncbi:MAG: hypothetical protein AB7F22_31445 [Reyranella sp.]|uniref:hypothetical protein n=1 Tax=Reyranella sp. TaxID=1929291 RepID=UPI003D0DE205